MNYSSLINTQMTRKMWGASGMRSLISHYVQGGLYAKAVNKPAADMLAKGLEIVDVSEDDARIINDEIRRLDLMRALTHAVQWARLEGAGVIIPVVDDGLDASQPLGPFDTIIGFRTYMGHNVSPLNIESDIYSFTDGEPSQYTVTGTGMQVGSYTVHRSRIIGIGGLELPADMRRFRADWCGGSLVGEGFAAIDDYLKGKKYVLEILSKKQQLVHAMEGMALKMMQKDGQSQVQKRIDFADAYRGLANMLAIDSKDRIDIHDLSLGGLNEAMSQLEIGVCAALGVPVSVMFGRSATGLNATGDGDTRNYDDDLIAYRSAQVDPAVQRCLELIMQQRTTRRITEWRYEWRPMREATEAEDADVELKEAAARKSCIEAMALAVSSQIMSAQEARKFLRGEDGGFDLDDDADFERSIDEALESERATVEAMTAAQASPADRAVAGSNAQQ